MTSKEKLQNICNYIESSITTNQMINVSFIEMISSDDEVMLAERKRQNRELAIDITLGEKEESEWDKRDTWGDQLSNTSDSNINIISPKVLSMSISKSTYKNHDEVYDYIINFIDKNTSNPKKLTNGAQSQQFNVKLGQGNYSPDATEYEKHESDIRRIITKINLCSSVISIDGRIGPGKVVLIGKNKKLMDDFGNITYPFIDKKEKSYIEYAMLDLNMDSWNGLSRFELSQLQRLHDSIMQFEGSNREDRFKEYLYSL